MDAPDEVMSTKGVEAAPLGVSFFNAKTPDGNTLDLALFGTPPQSFLAPTPKPGPLVRIPT